VLVEGLDNDQHTVTDLAGWAQPRPAPRDPLAYDRLDPEIRRIEREAINRLTCEPSRAAEVARILR
jgi:hypothetical protein